MSLGLVDGFTVFQANQQFGKAEGYNAIWMSEGTSGVQRHFFMGGNPSLGTLGINQYAAIFAGTVKKLIVRVLVVGGGRIDVFIQKNGVDVGVSIAAINTLGITTIDNIDVDFVAGDLINFRWVRNNSNTTFDIVCFIECEFNDADNIQHWYSNQNIKGSTLGFWKVGQAASPNIILTAEANHQIKMKQSGTVLDMNFYGISPVNAFRLPTMECRINGVAQASETLSQHAGRSVDLFTGINVPFVAGDLLSFAGLSSNVGLNLDGMMGARIEFDE